MLKFLDKLQECLVELVCRYFILVLFLVGLLLTLEYIVSEVQVWLEQ